MATAPHRLARCGVKDGAYECTAGRRRAANGSVSMRRSTTLLPSLLVAIFLASSITVRDAFGFQMTPRPSRANVGTRLQMVRNIDLPEALVFYGLESIMTQQMDDGTTSCALRPGVVRLLNECQEVGTAPLLLSEAIGEENEVALEFNNALAQISDDGKVLEALMKSCDPIINCRCLNSEFAIPPSTADDGASESDLSDEEDESLELYKLQAKGRSPSPAFLLDSLRSVRIDPRGFGGSSGFGRGQWIEPRRSPMTARTVVFVAGDWVSSSNDKGEIEQSTVRDRCAAARAAGCRIIYLEQLPGDTTQQHVEDDSQTMNLCDAVIDSFGNDNPRDLQPITLDAISTPGDYWLNPPSPRDDMGNAVALDEIVEYFRSEREMDDAVGDAECVVANDVGEDEMSEDEMNRILADLDGL